MNFRRCQIFEVLIQRYDTVKKKVKLIKPHKIQPYSLQIFKLKLRINFSKTTTRIRFFRALFNRCGVNPEMRRQNFRTALLTYFPLKVLVCSCNSENQIFWLLEERFRARFFQTGDQKLLFVNVIRLHKLYSIYQIIIQYTLSISVMQSNIKLMTVFCVYFGSIWFEIS